MKPSIPSLVLLAAASILAPGCAGSLGTSSDRLALVGSLPYLQPEAPPDLRSGRPVVVEFWATWCPPCVQSVPHLVAIDRRLEPEGLVMVGVHAPRGAGDEAGVRRFVAARGVEYAIALDRDGAASRAFGVSGIPRAFVFDRRGSMIWDGHPMDPAFESAVERAVGG